MESVGYRLHQYVDAVRSFLTEFYYISDRPGCAKLGEEEFRRSIKSLKENPHPDAGENRRNRPPAA